MCISFLLIICIISLLGCSQSSSDKESTVTRGSETRIDGFPLAEYEKYNSEESVGKYSGESICFEGLAKLLYYDGEKVFDTNDGSFQYIKGKTELMLSITQEDGKEWFVSFGNFDKEPFTSKEKLEAISGKAVRFSGVFCGYNKEYGNPIVRLYLNANSCGACKIEMLDDGKQYIFTDFRNDAKTMVSWCDKNVTTIFAEDIQNPENIRKACKTSGIIESMQRSNNLVNLYTKKRDGSIEIWKIDTTYKIGFVDGADLLNYKIGDSITLYYGVNANSIPYFFAATNAKDIDFTMEDVNKQFQTETSFPETNESSVPEISETESETSTHNVIYEDSSVIIKFLKVDSKGVHFDVENLTEKNITIQADSVSINGRSYNDIIMSDDIAPHSIGEVVAGCTISDYRTPVRTVGGQLRVIDFESWDTYTALIDNVVINEKIEIEQPQPTGTLVYESKKVRIYCKDVTRQGISFEVENLTGINLTIQADSLSINKRSINDIIMSDDVAPHSIGEVFAKCTPEYDGDANMISGQLRIIDSDKMNTSTAKFVDVDLNT